jgi:hypothetical protein
MTSTASVWGGLTLVADEPSMDIDPYEETVTLASREYMVIISAPLAELSQLRNVPDSENQESLVVGTCLGMNAHWIPGARPGTVTVLVGADDENWSVSLTLTRELVAEIAETASALAAEIQVRPLRR